MLRRIVLSAGALAGLVGGMAAVPAAAEAHSPHHPPVIVHRPHCSEYEVLIRHRHHFHAVGVFSNRYDAHRVAESYRCRGYDVEVRRV